MTTYQDLADAKAREAGIDPLAPSESLTVEFAPVAPDGVIWWVYATTDRDSFNVQDGWSVAARHVKVRKSGWDVVGPDWRPES